MTVSTIAFIGLGNMGLPMARNLVESGLKVKGYDPQLQADPPELPAGLSLSETLADCISDVQLIFTMLPNGAVVNSVLQQIIDAGSKPMAIIDCSTIDINDARAAHQLAANAGIGFLDSPVSGGIAGAAAGTLTTMVGGDESLFEQTKGITRAVFKNYVYCGAAGNGQAAKICNNMLLATSMIGTAESFNLGKGLGLDPSTLFTVLSTSTGSCWPVNNYCPVPGVGPDSPADNDYKPGFAAQMMLKDMKLTQSAAESVDMATPLGANALALYDAYVNEGGAAEDFSGIIRFLERQKRGA